MKVLSKLFKSAGASKIIVVDIHSSIGLKHFSIKTKNVTAIPDLVGFFKKLSLKNPLIVSPDQGGKERAKEFAKEFNSDYIALEKIRDKKTGKVKIKTKNLEEVKNLGIPFGFKLNAFVTTNPKDGYTNSYNISKTGNPNEFLGQRKDLTHELMANFVCLLYKS